MANGLATGAGQVDQRMIEEVAMMLQQGANPDELLAQGVPMEVLEMAMQMLQGQVAQEQGLARGPQGGGIAQAQGLMA